jgi:hypothetical protein
MRFSYRLIKDKSGIVAECVESEAAGEGKTEREAIASLRKALEERMFRPDAVAPPSRPAKEMAEIELVLADENAERKSIDLGGPGEAPVRG